MINPRERYRLLAIQHYGKANTEKQINSYVAQNSLQTTQSQAFFLDFLPWGRAEFQAAL
jgi:hypothetical protein